MTTEETLDQLDAVVASLAWRVIRHDKKIKELLTAADEPEPPGNLSSFIGDLPD